jgi:uncharacterized membrane protein YfcA
MWHFLWFIPLGLVIGTYGTLIGAGGGFVLMPVLLLLYPGEPPELLTSISLAVVFFNALSGSCAYARMGRVDYKSGLLFSIATIPGAILGAFSTAHVPRKLFDVVLGILMVAVSIFLLLRPKREKEANESNNNYCITRNLVEANGTNHTFSYNPVIGVGLSLFVGYLSSLLGIGGGIIHVPVLVYLLNFPAHIATATSHFTLAIMSLTGTIVHISTGVFSHGVRRTIFLAIGVIFGAQFGAKFSNYIHGKWIIRGLAIALGFVGIRIIFMVL